MRTNHREAPRTHIFVKQPRKEYVVKHQWLVEILNPLTGELLDSEIIRRLENCKFCDKDGMNIKVGTLKNCYYRKVYCHNTIRVSKVDPIKTKDAIKDTILEND